MLPEEQIPQTPPEAAILFSDETSLEARKLVRVYPYLSTTLLDCAERLVELSRLCEGRFREGMDISLSCRALSAGAITTATAGLEAIISEDLFNAVEWMSERGIAGSAHLLNLAMNLSPRERLVALGAASDEIIDWGREPYQALDIIFSVRKHLLHHELKPYAATEGHWPAKKLRDLQSRIKSPYSSNLNLNWDQHILTPAGAEWVVRVIFDVRDRMHNWWKILQSKYPEPSVD